MYYVNYVSTKLGKKRSVLPWSWVGLTSYGPLSKFDLPPVFLSSFVRAVILLVYLSEAGWHTTADMTECAVVATGTEWSAKPKRLLPGPFQKSLLSPGLGDKVKKQGGRWGPVQSPRWEVTGARPQEAMTSGRNQNMFRRENQQTEHR